MAIHDLVEIEVTHGDEGIFLKRTGSRKKNKYLAESNVFDKNIDVIKSPIKGTFYAAAKPDSEPFVNIGSEVTPRTLICIIEAMKVMNEINAETTGKIVGILVKNGQAVEDGTPLFKVKLE